MKFSIIVPVYNSQNTLRDCLDSIFSSEIKNFEVIVVNAKSADKSAEIAKRYPCKLIALEENKGAAFSRNTGKDNANGELLVFIDADVAIKKNTLGLIDESFREDKELAAVTGILSKESPHKDFFTQYKNLYMHYIFKKCPRYVDFLYGSLIAIRRDYFLRFDESFKITDDTELGQRYKKLNKKILLNPELEVVHFKKYDFKGIIKNDFFVPFWWAKSFMLHNGYKDILRKKRFSHARMAQIISIVVSYLLMISFLFWNKSWTRVFSFILLLIFFLLNYDFFTFLRRERGLSFSIKSIIFTYLDMLIMGLGVLAGFIYFNVFVRS
jgi:glycosyltransferase involved in cell wall biosynthesis